MATECTQAWENAATEHVNLRSLFEVGQPYMTIYNHGPITCSCHRILGNLYHVEGQPRTAQTVLCCGPGGVTVDVINVHAPSGRKKLTDQQRKTLLKNLPGSTSKPRPEGILGSGRFLIGGDMNTAPYLLSRLLFTSRQEGWLHTEEKIHEPVFGKHGDLCFAGGFKAETLSTTAENHDPMHKPYGICWSIAEEAATEHPVSSGTAHRGASSSGYATEQASQAPRTPAPTWGPACTARAAVQDLERRAEQNALTTNDIKGELEHLHGQHGTILKTGRLPGRV